MKSKLLCAGACSPSLSKELRRRKQSEANTCPLPVRDHRTNKRCYLKTRRKLMSLFVYNRHVFEAIAEVVQSSAFQNKTKQKYSH
jgi:hypothetical protein